MKRPDFPRYRLFLPEYCTLRSEQAAEIIVSHASKHRSYGVAALAVHGLMEAWNDQKLGSKINRIQMIVPDGQPVVWALNLFHKIDLTFKVPGPVLTSEVLRQADSKRLSVFLFGSTAGTLELFKAHISQTYPELSVVGVHADRFREATEEEDAQDVARINESGAHIVLVGRGCPRQEHWVADHVGKVNGAMMAVGAAFDYNAGTLRRAPMWAQKAGLEWLYRFMQEPRRLWRRYLVTNTQFVLQVVRHYISGHKPRKHYASGPET